MTGPVTEAFDFIVIGAGIAGASIAYELADAGSVVLLEREDTPGYHTTGRSAAIFTEAYGNDIVRRLTVASKPFYEHPPAGFTEHPLMSPRGTLYIARTDQHETLMDQLAAVSSLVPSIHEISVAETVDRVPALRADYLGATFIEPEAMDLDVHAIHGGYLKGLGERGGRVHTKAEAIGISRNGTQWSVTTRESGYAAPVVVNAAGAWCDEVAAMAGVAPVGLIPKRRTVITFDGPPGVELSDWPLVVDIDEEFYFKPESGRVMASPADETPMPPCDVQPDELDVAIAVDRMQRATTFDIQRISHRWAGLRSFVADKTQVVGMEPTADGFFWLAGQGGYGIQTAPTLARAGRELITRGCLPPDLTDRGIDAADLSPARFR